MDPNNEHQATTLQFTLVEETTKRPSPRENIVVVKQTHFELPSITVSSDPKRAREKREREQKLCTPGRLFRGTILVFGIVYCKRISEFMNGMVPQTVISTPRVKRDYTSIKGIHDLSSINIKPRCFSGVIDCPCQDPTVPIMGNTDRWLNTHLINQKLAQSEQAQKVDVVFFGDSITESWRETELGMQILRPYGSVEIFESLFSRNNGGKYNGLPLGIAGDTSPMLLWRIQNGELPSNLNPLVFWLLIGTNDIGRTWCSPEMVVVGVIRNVEEILIQKPFAHVVINGILPRSFNKDGFLARGGPVKPSVWDDIRTINSELKMYATYRDRVSYFETNVFFRHPDVPNNQLQIEKDLMPDLLHPSPTGYKLWGEEIVKVLDTLIISNSEEYYNDDLGDRRTMV